MPCFRLKAGNPLRLSRSTGYGRIGWGRAPVGWNGKLRSGSRGFAQGRDNGFPVVSCGGYDFVQYLLLLLVTGLGIAHPHTFR